MTDRYKADPEDAGFVTIYMTAESEDAATHIGITLVKERLVACANVNAGTRSVYEYNGVLELDNEVTVYMKTRADKAEDAVARIREIHNYEVPCVTVLPILGGNPDYLRWVSAQVEAAAIDSSPLFEGDH